MKKIWNPTKIILQAAAYDGFVGIDQTEFQRINKKLGNVLMKRNSGRKDHNFK